MPLEKLAFVVPGLLAGSKYPSEDNETLQQIVTGEHKFKTLISLTEASHPAGQKLVDQFGLKNYIHLPISDFSTPTDSQIRQFCEILLETKENDDGTSNFVNTPVLIHCHLGAGRTGLMLSIGIAAYFYHFCNYNNNNKTAAVGVKENQYENVKSILASKISLTNLYQTLISYHQSVRPQSIMTTRQLRFLEKFLMEEDEEKRTNLLSKI